MRKVYGHDQLRLLRCHTCGEECSERRGRALCNTKIAEEKAADVIHHLDEGCGVRTTARLVLGVATRCPDTGEVAPRGRSCAGPKGWPMGKGKTSLKAGGSSGSTSVPSMAKRRTPVLSLLGYQPINTRVVERHNGTSRLRNRRKVRKTLTFSKAKQYHRWMSWLSVTLDNFCRAYGSLQVKQEAQVRHRSPAMAAR